MTGLCDSLSRTVLACHSIQFSRFSRGEISRVILRFCPPLTPEPWLGSGVIHYALTLGVSTTDFQLLARHFDHSPKGYETPRLINARAQIHPGHCLEEGRSRRPAECKDAH